MPRDDGSHFSTSEVVTIAKRAANIGFRIIIDLHYSDSRADPSKQNKPAAWVNDSFSQLLLNPNYLLCDNDKYIKMYDWMSRGYDFAESFIGRLKYDNTINEMREQIMYKLEWMDNCSVLHVSIGTGLKFIPGFVNKETIDIVGVDISF